MQTHRKQVARLSFLGLLAAGFAFVPLAADARVSEAEPARPHEIIVVFKTHFDIGYTDLVTNILTRYRTHFVDRALAVIDQSRSLPPEQQFTWTIPGWPLKEMAGSGQTPERRERLLRAFKEGRLAVHAMPFSLQTETLDLEDLVQGMTYSARFAREAGLPLPRAAKMTDVPAHAWITPTLLHHSGVTFLHIGCNGGSYPMAVPPLFWWEGPDGSRLLTFYSPEYGTDLLPPDDWPYRTWLALMMTGDNHGPPTADEVNQLLARVAKEMPGAKVRFGKMEDFYDTFMAEGATNVPVVRGDMPDTWIHGFGAVPIETRLAWNARPLEGATALLDTELRACGLSVPPVASDLALAYENSLLFSEHTFGYFGSQPGGFWYGDEWKQKLAQGKYDRFLRSFEDKKDYIRTTAKLMTNALGVRMGLLARNVNASGARVVVFNPLPWERSGQVEVAAPGAVWGGARDLATGKPAPAFARNRDKVRFLAEGVPAGGYKTFEPMAGQPVAVSRPGTTGVIENAFFRLRVDPVRGGVVSFVDLKTGRELVSTQDEHSFGSFWHERFASTNVQAFVRAYTRGWGRTGADFNKPNMPGPEQSPYATFTLSNWTLSAESSPAGQTIVLRCADAAPLAKAVTLRYTLPAAQPYLDLEWSIEDKTPNPIPEGGWLCLPFNLDSPQFQLARAGCLIDPARDILDGANRHLLCLNSGMTVTGADGIGVGLCPLDSPLVSLDEPGLWKFSLHYTPRRARVFINLYNNEWDTNYPLWQAGSWSSRVRLWLAQSGNPEAALITPAWEARSPLVAAFADGAGGKLPVTKPGLKLSRPGVLVPLLGPDPYSDKTLLRVWEQAGQGSSLTVTLPADLQATRAVPVNLRGEPAGEPLRIQDHALTFKLAAFAPASFRLE